MGSGMPPPQNYQGAAQQQADASQQAVNQQTQANRPNQSSPFASTNWTQGPDGQWQQSTSFNGPLGGLSNSLQQQAASAMGTPFSLSGLPALTDGASARDQAISSAYGQATSRLDPQFAQREQALKSQLAGQGLAPGSEAYNNALADFGRERNDAYSSAMNGAIGQGTAAGSALFQQSLAGRQNALSELLRGRGQAFGELQGLQGLTGQQGFQGAGLAQTPDYLGAAGLQGSQDWQRYQQQQQQMTDYVNGGVGLLSSALPFFLCDARTKVGTMLLPPKIYGEVLPGVPWYTYRYREGMGPEGLWTGCMAQDLQRVRPDAVHVREDGYLAVHPDFAPRRLA